MKRLRRFQDMFLATGLDPDEAPFIIERLRGTPSRVRELTQDLTGKQLTNKPGDEWSVMQHLNHLIAADIEFAGRIRQYRQGSEVLRGDLEGDIPAQLGDDPRTMSREELLSAFDAARRDLLELVENLTPESYAHTIYFRDSDRSLSLVDKLFFIAQHDDSHLAWLWRLSQGLVK